MNRSTRLGTFSALIALVVLTGCGRRPPTLRGVSLGPDRGCGVSKKDEVWCFPALLTDARAEISARTADDVVVIEKAVVLRRGSVVSCIGDCPPAAWSQTATKVRGGGTNSVWVLGPKGELSTYNVRTGDRDVRVPKDVAEFAAGPFGLLYRRTDNAVFFSRPELVEASEVPSLKGAMSIAVGRAHACAVLPTAEVQCFGRNTYGQLGDGTKEDRNLPTNVQGLDGAVEVSAGDDFSCARLGNATVSCWGNNDVNQITSGGPGSMVLTPRPIIGIFGATALSSFGQGSCAALGQEEGARCWGKGHFGIPSTDSSLRVPMPVRFPKR